MLQRVIILCLFSIILNASLLSDLKKLQYKEQTKENVTLYKSGLEKLVSQENVEAILMLAHAYQSGSHWKKSETKAMNYYKKAAQLGSGKAFMQLGMFFYNQEDLENAKNFFISALNSGEKNSITYLLEISITNKNKEDTQRFFKLSRKNNIPIDELTLKQIKQKKNKKSDVMKYIEEKTFNMSKDYILGILKTISSLDGAFKNLGYEVDEYIVHNGLEPTVELILNKITNANINEEMAMLIAGDNILKKSVLNSLIWANAIDPFMKNEVGYQLSRVEIEVGTNAVAKIVTKRVKND